MDFVPIDFSAPLDTSERLAQMDPNWPIKGIFFVATINTLKSLGIDRPDLFKNYSALSTYSCRDLINLLDTCSTSFYPEFTPRRTLFELGRRVIPDLINEPTGAAFYTITGGDLATAFKMTHRIYNILSTTSAKILESSDNMVIIKLTDAWVYPTCYHTGVYYGAMEFFNKTNSKISIYEHSISEVDIKCEW